MRTVYITTSCPLPTNSGQRRRIAAIWKALAALGEVRVIAFDLRPAMADRNILAQNGITVLPPRTETAWARNLRHASAFLRGESMLVAKWMSARRMERLRAGIAEARPDLIVLGDTILAPLIETVRPLARRVVIDTHNVDSLLFHRIYRSARGAAKLKNFLFYRNLLTLQRKLHLADKVWAVSDSDAGYYRDVLRLTQISLVPNVIDLDEYAPDESAAEEGAVVFTGNFAYWPNEDAALRLIRMAEQLRSRSGPFRLYLVGRAPTERMIAQARARADIVITGEVADIRPYIRRASIVAAPLRAGSGTKFKILEAMALAKPVVTTDIGREGLGIVPGIDAVLARDEASFAAEVAALLADAERRRTLGAAARRFVEANYGMGRLVDAMRDAIPSSWPDLSRASTPSSAPPQDVGLARP